MDNTMGRGKHPLPTIAVPSHQTTSTTVAEPQERRETFSRKQKQARRHTATIQKLLQRSPFCSDCGQQMNQDSVFSVRPHLICDEAGQRLICGKCHREGDHGPPVRMYQHGTH